MLPEYELIDFETFWAELQKDNSKYLEYKASSENEWFDFIKKEIDEIANILSKEDKATKAIVIWNLMCIGHSDTFYSSIENRIVKYLADKWSIEKETLGDFIDIAETMLILHNQSLWIHSSYKKSVLRDKKEKEINTQQKELYEDIQMTIKEITI